MHGLLLALLLAPQIQPGSQDQPLKNWKVQRREPNVQTGQMEIVAIIEGDEAIPRGVTKDKGAFEVKSADITGPRLRYFTDPKKPEERSEEVKLRSDKGHFDDDKGRVDLWGHVRIEKLPPPEGDGTVLEAPEAVLFFKKRYVCPVHGGKAEAPGKCPTCKAELKPRTYSSIEAPKAFEMTQIEPPTRMTGEGLTATDDIRKVRVERDGCLILAGAPKDLRPAAPNPAPSKPTVTELRSKGPMTFLEGDDGVSSVACEKEAWIQRTEVLPEGTAMTTITADSGELLARRGAGPKKDPEPEKLTARGRVTMTTRDPKSGEPTTAKADSLVWTGMKDYDVSQLDGAVEVESGKSTIRSKSARIERLLGVSNFTDDVSARLVRSPEADAPPFNLKSKTLTLRSVPGGRDVQEVEALGDVVLDGLNPGSGGSAARAEADRFLWSQEENHGLLEKRPFVRVLQEDLTMLAPRVVLEGDSMIVLKGPKQVIITQKDEKGEPTRYDVTSEGDIVLEKSEERTVIRLQDSCALRTGDFHLFSDRMTVATAKDGKEMEKLNAWGRVRVRQLNKEGSQARKDSGTLFGEWLTFVPQTPTRPQEMILTGSPIVRLDAGHRTATQEQLRIYEKVDPDTGQKVQYQEMRGGRRGVRIVIDRSSP